MWRAAGVRRDGPPLADAARTIRRWCGYVLARQLTDPSGWELQNMLTVASLMVEAALRRRIARRAVTNRFSRDGRCPLAAASDDGAREITPFLSKNW